MASAAATAQRCDILRSPGNGASDFAIANELGISAAVLTCEQGTERAQPLRMVYQRNTGTCLMVEH